MRKNKPLDLVPTQLDQVKFRLALNCTMRHAQTNLNGRSGENVTWTQSLVCTLKPCVSSPAIVRSFVRCLTTRHHQIVRCICSMGFAWWLPRIWSSRKCPIKNINHALHGLGDLHLHTLTVTMVQSKAVGALPTWVCPEKVAFR